MHHIPTFDSLISTRHREKNIVYTMALPHKHVTTVSVKRKETEQDIIPLVIYDESREKKRKEKKIGIRPSS